MNIPLSPKQNNFNVKYTNFLNRLDSFEKCKQNSYLINTSLFDMTQKYYYANYFPYYNTITMNSDSSYTQWQYDHEVDISLQHPFEKIKVHRKKEIVIINERIASFKDILDILEKHPVKSNIQYNIDLKTLHKIKPELERLNDMVGLDCLKKSLLRQLIYFIQGFANDPLNGDYKHTMITGPPGTGKTELAKIIGLMYAKIGILSNTHFKKVTRTDLIAGYLGQTAIKTKKVIDECIGGVLFIDEAYSLQPDDMYAKECVDTLCEALSDHKNKLMVIIAGYKDELKNTFFRINNGLESRFTWNFNIDPYSPNELSQIFSLIVKNCGWDTCDNITENWFNKNKDSFKSNGRDMEQLFSFSKISHAQRIYGKLDAEKKKLSLEDINEGFILFKENMNTNKDNISFGLYI